MEHQHLARQLAQPDRAALVVVGLQMLLDQEQALAARATHHLQRRLKEIVVEHLQAERQVIQAAAAVAQARQVQLIQVDQ
jgi:RNase H-fold protein (predicted Holliday junction resolvase)